jgi:hypothetical protein
MAKRPGKTALYKLFTGVIFTVKTFFTAWINKSLHKLFTPSVKAWHFKTGELQR